MPATRLLTDARRSFTIPTNTGIYWSRFDLSDSLLDGKMIFTKRRDQTEVASLQLLSQRQDSNTVVVYSQVSRGSWPILGSKFMISALR